MADILAQLLKRNLGAAVVKTVGAASQTLPWERSDENYVLYIENADALPCRIKFKVTGYGGENAPDLDVDIAAGEFAAVGALESMYFISPADQNLTFEIVDQDDTPFSGTVTNVKIIAFELPKSLTN